MGISKTSSSRFGALLLLTIAGLCWGLSSCAMTRAGVEKPNCPFPGNCFKQGEKLLSSLERAPTKQSLRAVAEMLPELSWMGPSEVVQQWRRLQGAAILSAPVIDANQRVFVTSGRGPGHSHLHAFSAAGEELWKSLPYSADIGVGPGVALHSPLLDTAGNVYVTDDQHLWSFSGDGNLRWRSALLGNIGLSDGARSIFLLDKYIAIISGNGAIGLFKLSNGLQFRSTMQLPISGKKPADLPLPEHVWKGEMLDPSIAQRAWNQLSGQRGAISNVLVHPDNSRIYFSMVGEATTHGLLYGVDWRKTGDSRIAFVQSLPQGVSGDLVMSVDASRIYLVDGRNVLLAVSLQDGSTLWRSIAAGNRAVAQNFAENLVYSYGDRADIAAINATTGERRWRRSYAHLTHNLLPRSSHGKRVMHIHHLRPFSARYLLAVAEMGYEVEFGNLSAPYASRSIAIAIDGRNGDVVAWSELSSASAGMLAADALGGFYLGVNGASESLNYYGQNALPASMRGVPAPHAGLIAYRPNSNFALISESLIWTHHLLDELDRAGRAGDRSRLAYLARQTNFQFQIVDHLMSRGMPEKLMRATRRSMRRVTKQLKRGEYSDRSIARIASARAYINALNKALRVSRPKHASR